MDDLITWLRAQLDVDENGGKPDQHTWSCGYDQIEFGTECVCGLPDRVLREVEAKRRMLQEHRTEIIETAGSFWCDVCDIPGDIPGRTWCVTVRLLALPYADRPGYQEGWKP